MQIIKFDEQGSTPGPIELPFSCTEDGTHPGNLADPARVLAVYQANGYVAYEGDPECNPDTHRLGDYYPEGGVGKRYLVQLTVGELAVNLDRLKEAKRQAIREALSEVEPLPVMDANGLWWNGGLSSALRLDGGKRLAMETGAQSVVFYDIYNGPHDLSFLEASMVIYTVAGAFRVDFDHKQALMLQIDAAETKAAVEAITW